MTHDWLSSYMLPSSACYELRDERRAGVLRDILVPFQGHVWIMGLGTFIGGLVAVGLGDLNTLLRDWDKRTSTTTRRSTWPSV